MPLPKSCLDAQQLDQQLGDFQDPRNPAGLKAALDADEAEQFPQGFVDALAQHGVFGWFVPVAVGGALDTLEGLNARIRVIARRDVTTAIALGQSFLGSLPIWVGGSDAQRARVARLLLGGTAAGLGLTEEAHGSDLLASDVRAVRERDRYRLTGTKWLINNATRGGLLTVLANTTPDRGLYGTSLFAVEKASVDRRSLRPVQKQRTHGIRGADISGLEFCDALVPEDARVGAEGSGMDLVLKSLQVSRIGCAAFSLGAADTALRLALDFATRRTLYGQRATDIPHVRAMLSGAFADLLLCDALALGAVRGAHTATSQMSVVSAYVKYFVPTRVEQLIRDTAVVLGARHYVRSHPEFGAFQKVMRDAAVVSLFDGSTAVNLEALALQLPRILGGRVPPETAGLATRFRVHDALPPADLSQLELLNGGLEETLQGAGAAVEALHAEARPELATWLHQLRAAVDTLGQDFKRASSAEGDRTALRRSAPLFRLARRGAALAAATSAVQLYRFNRTALGPAFEDPAWLVACLRRVLDPAEATEGLTDADALWEGLQQRHREQLTFSLLPLQLRP